MAAKKIIKVENTLVSLLEHMQDSYVSASDIQRQALDEYKHIKDSFDSTALSDAIEVNKMLDSKLKTALDSLKLTVEVSKIHERLVKNDMGGADGGEEKEPSGDNKLGSKYMQQIKEELNKMKHEIYNVD